MIINEIASLCLFSFLCFGEQQSNQFNDSQCEHYNQRQDKISLNCHNGSALERYKDLEVHTLAINGTPSDIQKTLVNMKFNHLIIQSAQFNVSMRQDRLNDETVAHKSLTIVRSSNIAAWSWANFNFKYIYFEDCLLNPVDDKNSYKIVTSEFLPATLLSLALIDCRIVSIGDGSLGFLNSIQTLTITHNHLTSFSRTALPAEAPDLWSIDLSFNKIATLSDNFTKNLPALKELNLRNNQLITLPAGLFSPTMSISEIDLADNPLTCENFCWMFTNESLPHPKLLDQTQCVLSNQESVILAWSNPNDIGCTDKKSCIS